MARSKKKRKKALAGDARGRAALRGSPRAWAFVAGGGSLGLALLSFDPYLFTGGDNATYYALAQALVTGRGYVDLVHPATPAHTLYPPGFPALLVPFYLISGGSLVAMKLLSLAAGAALLWGLWRLARLDPAVSDWAAVGAVGLVGLYPAFLEYTHWVLSDMAFAAVATGALYALQRASGPDGEERWGSWLLAIALALAAFYVRTAGVAVLGAAVGWALLRRRWLRATAAAGVAAAGALPWILWVQRGAAGAGPGGPPGATADYLEQVSAATPGGGGAGRWLDFLVERVGEVAVEYGTWQLPGLFWPDPTPAGAVRAAGAILGGALLVWGIVRALRSRGPRPWDLYVLLTLGLLVPWPWLGARFLLTLAPFLWLYLLVGLDDLSRLATGGPRAGVAVALAVGLALLVGGAAGATRQLPRTRAWLAGDRLAGYDPFWSDYFDAARWIGDHASPDAVVLARKPSLVWYWSGRPTVVYPFGAGPDETWAFIQETGVTHFLFEPSTEQALAPALAPRQDRLELLYRPPGGGAAVVGLRTP